MEEKSKKTDDIFVYIRVSTDKQTEKGTYENQESAIKEFLKDKDVNIVEIFKELGESGANLDRPMMNAMINRLDEVDGICVYDWDRLTRDEEFGVMLMYKMKKLGKKVYESRSRNILKFEEMGERVMTVLKSMIAQEERTKIKARQKMGIKRFKEKNERWGPKIKKINWKKFDEYKELGLANTSICKLMGMSQKTLYRRLKDRQVTENVQ